MAPKKSMFKKSRRTRIRRGRGKRRIYNTQVVGGPNTATATMTYGSGLDQNAYYEEIVEGLNTAPGTRVLDIAKNYALYRIAKVVMKFKPKFDTYMPNAVTPGSGPAEVPYLYWIMDRYGDLMAPAGLANSTYFINQGAKAIRFDDKTVTVVFRPNVILDSANRQIKMTPWLSTDNGEGTGDWTPSQSLHHGIQYAVIGAASGSATGPVGTVETTVYYQFKNPLVDLSTPGQQRQRVKVSNTQFKWINSNDISDNSLTV